MNETSRPSAPSQRSVPLTDPLMSSTEPGRCWTSINTAEAMQGVLTPLDWTFQSHGIELGGRQVWVDFGLLKKGDVYLTTDANDSFMGVFFGRVGINVEFAANMMDRLPKMSGKDLELGLTGEAREGVVRPGTDRKRVPFVLVGKTVVPLTTSRKMHAMHHRLRPWWSTEVAHLESGRRSGREVLLEALHNFDEAMHLHLRARFGMMFAQSRLAPLLARTRMMADMLPLMAAAGIEEANVAEDLWALSRNGLTMAEFLARHGYHGPNEFVISAHSWREDPRPVELVATSLAKQADSDSPAERCERALVHRRELETKFLAASKRSSRLKARRALTGVQRAVRQNEMGKMLTLLCVDTARAAARVFGAELARDGVVDEPDDVQYFTVAEIDQGLPTNGRELVAFRRERRQEYLAYDLPLHWFGAPEPLIVADQRPEVLAGDVVQGFPANAGVYEGRARVVHDPTVEALEPGEVLICNVTDPSWVALMALAGAVVVDIGGPTSHGAIVAREFGLPCVVSTVVGSKVIASGDRVRVDGGSGKVEILERA